MNLPRKLPAVLCAVILFGISSLVSAGPPQPAVPSLPPRPPDGLAVESGPVSPSLLAQTLPPLKAVLIVGPIDGDYGSWTTSEKANMDLAASELQANGVTVYKFYAPNNDWNQIKAAANGAHFLMYRGHGVYSSGTNPKTVGGFSLSSPTGFKSSSDIRNDLALAPNAIIMLYGCFTAGTSSSDSGDIGITEARRRVAQYSDPFFDIGAAGYYADWFGNAFQMFARYLFQGQTLGQAYESFFDFNASTVNRGTYPDHPDKVMWLDKDFWDGYWQYNNAFAGLSNQTLEDLFGGMVVNPEARTHLAEPSYPSHTYTIDVTGPVNEPFNWTATVSPPVIWMSASPLTGASGQSITVVIMPTGMETGTYETRIDIVADDPQIQNGEQTSSVRLVVADQLSHVHLPVVFK